MPFQRKTLFLLSVAVLAGCSSPTQRFQKHINYLASDRLQGRGLGTHGLDLAADYIAKEFREEGLEPGGDDGTYFQKFPITYHRELSGESRLAVANDSKTRREGLDFIPFDFSSSGKFSGDIVFCGFGIVANEKDHDDFKGVELQGRVALIFDGEPKPWSDANGGVPTRFSLLRDKIYNAKDHDAAAILVVNLAPEPGAKDQLASFSPETADDYGIPAMQITREVAAEILSRGGAGDISNVEKATVADTSKSIALSNVSVDGETVFRKKTTTARNVIGIRTGHGPRADEWIVIGAHYDHLGIRKPMMRRFVNGKLVKENLAPQIHNGADDNASGVAGVIEIARMFKKEPIERGIMFIAFTGEEAGLLGSKHFVEHPTIPLDQTVAMLNMDMIGRLSRVTPRAKSPSTQETSSAPTDTPHSEANPHAEVNPHAAGGVASATSDPSEANPHASANLHVVSPATPAPEVFGLSNGDGRVQVFGTDCGTNFRDLVMREAKPLGLKIAVGIDEGGRSDHASFLRKQIPSMHFFSGNHPDYHQPSDDSWKINAEGGERIAELVFHVAEDLDIQPERPMFQIVKRDRQTPAGGVTSFRVVMGLTPNYAADGQEGMGVDGVSPQGPADLAGLKPGDRITSIGGKKVANVYDYMAATRHNNPGDVVDVSVLRDGKPLILKVTLSGTR